MVESKQGVHPEPMRHHLKSPIIFQGFRIKGRQKSHQEPSSGFHSEPRQQGPAGVLLLIIRFFLRPYNDRLVFGAERVSSATTANPQQAQGFHESTRSSTKDPFVLPTFQLEPTWKVYGELFCFKSLIQIIRKRATKNQRVGTFEIHRNLLLVAQRSKEVLLLACLDHVINLILVVLAGFSFFLPCWRWRISPVLSDSQQ